MAPIAVRGGGESHTLSIEDQGETVVPMIRSTQQTLQSWLDERPNAPLEELARTSGWEGDEKAQKKTELETLVARAKTEEAELDRAAEAAEDAINADPATATDEQQSTSQEGEQTKRALEQVLEFFGIDPNANLAEHFSEGIGRLRLDVADQLRANVLNGLDTPRYLTMEWSQAPSAIAGEAALPGAWQRPAASGGIVRRVFENDFQTRVAQLAEAEIGERTFGGDENAAAVADLLDNFVTERLNRSPQPQAIIAALLDGSPQSVNAVLSPVESAIKEGARAYRDAHSDAPDIELFDTIKGSTVFGHMRAFAEGNSPSFTIRNPNQADGAATGTADLLEAITNSGKTDRYTKNRTYVASMIRNAPGLVERPHEWVQAASADRVLQHAANALESGDQKSLKAASELIEFQEKVRTPTFKLIFKPSGQYGGNVAVTFRARAHREDAEYADKRPDELPENLRSQWYPAGSPQYGDELGVLQAHSGGLYAFAQGGSFRTSLVSQSEGSGTWHDDLTEQVQAAAGQMVSTGNATPLKYAILGFYRSTIWEGTGNPTGTGGRLFQNYYRNQSESSLTSYGALKSEFTSEFRTVFGELANSINIVLGR